MAVDTGPLKAKVEGWAVTSHRRAVEDVLGQLDDVVPRGSGPRSGSTPLANSRRVTIDPLSASVAYPPLGRLLNTGTRPHVIRARRARVLSFVWPTGPRALASNPATARFYFPQVNHPGSTKHRGWWDGVVNDRRWGVALDRAARSTRF